MSRFESNALLVASLVGLSAGPVVASGTLLNSGVFVQSFADGSGTTPMSAENDGTYIWTAQGDHPFDNLARYLSGGTLDQLFQPGPDFRSLYSDNAGNLFAKEFGPGNVWSITQAGVGTILYTLNDPAFQSAASLNGDDTELYTMSGGEIRRYDATNGALLGSFALVGWGSIGTETDFPDEYQMETTATGRILTYTQGIVSEWDLAGNRVGRCNVAIATQSGTETTWSFGVDGCGRVYLYEETTATWRVYDIGAGGTCGGEPGTPVCFGDGSGISCPCGNDGNPGTGGGCTNAAPMPAGQGAALSASGSNSIVADNLVLTADFTTNQPGLFFQGNGVIGGGTGITFGDGIRCCGVNVIRLEIADPAGTNGPHTTSTTQPILGTSPVGTTTPGDTRCYQWWYRNPGTSVCGFNFNLSNAVLVTWTL